jgi:hypothetical protein
MAKKMENGVFVADAYAKQCHLAPPKFVPSRSSAGECLLLLIRLDFGSFLF